MLPSPLKMFNSLTLSQRKAVLLLSTSTFLEYFDVMLYIHMAVVLNELFFSSSGLKFSDAIGYTATFALRPIWALIIGRIGDTIGRKSTVIFTVLLASTSCILIAVLPTYSQIGIFATILFVFCRITQGLAAMGEVIGADIYLMETIKPPAQYPISGLTTIAASLGGFAALAFASFAVSTNFNWRFAFITGATVTLLTALARKTLHETPEFLYAISKAKTKAVHNTTTSNFNFSNKTALAIFAMDCGWPLGFYLLYAYCNNILKSKFGYSAEQIINHNLTIGITLLFNHIVITCLSYKFHPLKMLKFRIFIFSALVIFYPYIVSTASSASHILALQILITFVPIDLVTATPIILKHIPTLKRFTYSAFLYSISKAVITVVTSFGFIYLIEKYGKLGPLFLIVPIVISCITGVLYFHKLEFTK